MKWYVVVAERAGRNDSACSPDLPDCVATGATPEETRTRMQEAIELHLQGLSERNQPAPEPTTEAFTVEVP